MSAHQRRTPGRSTLKRLTAVAGTALAAVTLAACLIPVPIPFPVGPEPAPPEPDVSEEAEGFDRFTDQSLNWDDCSGEFQCAYAVAPMDWDDPDSEPIKLSLIKHAATGRETLGTLFVNPGGPGSSGVEFLKGSVNAGVTPVIQEYYDIVSWDPRGVAGSEAVHCFTDAELDEELFGDPREWAGLEPGTEEWFEIARESSRAYGEACLEGTGDLLGHVDTLSTAKDLDLLRHLVGDDTLNYLGYSYGTFLGAVYAEAFPENTGRLVLDGALAPDVTMHEVVLQQQLGFENAMRAYLARCLAGFECFFSGTVGDAMQEISRMLAEIDENPIKAPDGRWVSVDTFLTAIILPLYGEASWPFLDSLFEEMSVGNTDTAQFLADYYYGRENGVYIDNSTEAFSAINCLDYPSGVTEDQMREQAEEIARAAPTFGPYSGYGDVFCQEWPFEGVTERGPIEAQGAAPILVIGTTGDPATPYVWARRLADQLASGVLVTYNGEGHTTYAGGSACVNNAVDAFLLEGTAPAEDPNC